MNSALNSNSPGVGSDSAKPDAKSRAIPSFASAAAVAVSLLLIGAIIFRNFLFGSSVLLYKDVGADSVNDSYPYFVHLSDYIRHNRFPSWSFCVGMGQSLFYLAGNLIWEPVIWLPREWIARALVYQHLAKTLIAGLLFFGFLRVRGLNLCASWLGSIQLAFSSYMCMGSCWVINADEIVGFAFLLFATEVALSRGTWIYLPFATALLGMVTVFHFYLGALLLCFYLAARFLEMSADQRRSSQSVWMRILAAAALGVGLAAAVWLPSLQAILNSPRGSGMIPNFAFGASPPKVFQFDSPLYYFTAALRLFSNDLLGSGDKFLGWENYFEAPITYCGLLPILMLPQAFVGASKGQRVVYALFLCVIIIPVVFPWFRYLFWAFRGGYFRAFSLFSVLGIITLSAKAFSEYTERGRLHVIVLAATIVGLLFFLFLPVRQMQTLIDPKLRLLTVAFLVFYAATLAAGHLLNRHRIAGWVIVVAVAIKLICFNGPTVDRTTVTKEELDQRIGYNDETVDVVRDLKASDHDFFRVTKMWGSGPANRVSYNDAMIFGYYGTSSYSSFNNVDYIRFLIAVGAIPADNIATDAQWSPGLIWEPLLSTFACEKYAITTDPQRFESADHYEFMKRYNDVYLFRNTVAIPLGLLFDQYLPEDVFLQMPDWAKAQALIQVVVLGGKDGGARTALQEVTLEDLKDRLRQVPIKDALAEKKATAFKLAGFRDTRIEGDAKLSRPGMLVFQIPFDSGWHAVVDRQPTRLTKVDIGLIGLELNAGEHAVQLHYIPPFLYFGASVSFVSVLLLLAGLRKWPRTVD